MDISAEADDIAEVAVGEAEDPRITEARGALLEGVGAEIASTFPGITRLGGQIVAALYLADDARTMDQLSALLGCSKSNIFTNLKGLEANGIVRRRRVAGSRSDSYALTGPYPDVIVGAYIRLLRHLVADKRALARRAVDMLGDAQGAEADRLRERLAEVLRKYNLFATIVADLPESDGPVDLERMLSKLTPEMLGAFKAAASVAWRRDD